ncbi:hypothetical protein Ciccas_008111 [Cichlidogyrus casuarinus]|uniref:Uncharacterized protein n=1 Tax=Cichlidogyrus casuarinus TaxID=1844966 RepID=A0ABD2Q2B0_9PLAT
MRPQIVISEVTSQTTFQASICSPMVCGQETESNTAVCIQGTKITYSVGSWNTAKVTVEENEGALTASIVYSIAGQESSEIVLQCDESLTKPILKSIPGTMPVTLTLMAKEACWKYNPGPSGSGRLSVGSAILITLAVVSVVYVAAGIGYNVGYKKRSGAHIFPNYEGWCVLIANSIYGIKYTKGKVCKCGHPSEERQPLL